MVRTTFTGQLAQLQQELHNLGAMVLSRLDTLIAAQEKLDVEQGAVSYDDEAVNSAWRALENEATRVLALQQPVVASDLRLVTFALIVAQELEHISDFARDTAAELTMIRSTPAPLPELPELNDLARLARAMLATALEAFEQADADIARGLALKLAEAQVLARRLPDTLKSFAWSDARAFEIALGLVDVVGLWQHIAEHATEIGERVIILLTDQHEDLHSAPRLKQLAAQAVQPA